MTVTGMTSEGYGVAHHDGLAVFVPCTAPGDALRAHVVKVQKNYVYAKMVELLTPSPSRIDNDCPAFLQCGGCTYRHIHYGAEQQIKWERVRDALQRIAQVNMIPEPLVAAESPDRYRNKAQYPVGRHGSLQIGFYAKNSHRIVTCADCQLQPPLFADIVRIVADWIEAHQIACYDEETQQGLLRHIYIRMAQGTGQIMLCLVINGSTLPHYQDLLPVLAAQVPGLHSVVLNHNTRHSNVILGDRCTTLWGEDTLTDTLCGLQFTLSPLSFYQVNRAGAERLYTLAKTYAGLTGKETLLDLYCGTGTIGLTMAHEARTVIGVEVVSAAVEDARRNAARNGIQNARFLCSDAAGAAEQLAAEGIRPDVVVVDPPRKGCSAPLLDTLSQMCPERIVYIACDPGTLARDIKTLTGKGYALQQCTPVDMFPRTPHVECVCLMTRTQCRGK